jgi:hypothetical protein
MMTIRSALKVSQVQINLLSEIAELTDEGFIYSTTIHDKRLRTLKALERRGLLLLDTVELTRNQFIRVHPTPHGREMLHYLK